MYSTIYTFERVVLKEKFLQDQNAKGGVLDCNVLEV